MTHRSWSVDFVVSGAIGSTEFVRMHSLGIRTDNCKPYKYKASLPGGGVALARGGLSAFVESLRQHFEARAESDGWEKVVVSTTRVERDPC